MLTKVTRLERLGGFRLRVQFNDGSCFDTAPEWLRREMAAAQVEAE
jgi:hypothetical protein